MTKKIKYLIALNILLLAAISLSLKNSSTSSTLNNLDTQFALADSSLVYRVVLGKNNFVKQENGTWIINETFQVDNRRMQSLLTVLQRIDVKRPAAERIKKSVKAELQGKGYQVATFDESGQALQNFQLINKEDESYAALGQADPYIIYIPGSPINVSEWLSAEEINWRDRKVLYTTWRTLKRLKVDYRGNAQSSFEISFDNNFYNVSGVSKLDSAAVYDYLVQFQEFKAGKFLTDRPNLADSLSKLSELCTISIQDLYAERDNTLKVYPTENNLYGVLQKDQEVVLINPRVLETILVPKANFEKKE